jgi:hypothetical protein
MNIPNSTDLFVFTMNTSRSESKGCLSAFIATMDLLPGDADEKELELTFSTFENIRKVVVSLFINQDSSTDFTITFKSVHGELPLLVQSLSSIKVTHSDEQIGVTEVQSIAMSSDHAVVYEVLSLSVLESEKSFWLSYADSNLTQSFNCHFSNQTEAAGLADSLKVEIEKVAPVKVAIDPFISGSGLQDNPWIYTITFIEPVGPQPLLVSNNVEVKELREGFFPLIGSFVLD